MTIASIVHKDGYLEITDSDGNFYRIEVKWEDCVVSAIESSGQYKVVNMHYRTSDGHLIVVYTDGTTQTELDVDPAGGGVTDHGDLTGVTTSQHHTKYTGAEAKAAAIAGWTANRALQISAGGTLQVSAVTLAELNFLDGVTSAIQTQLSGKLANVVEDTTPQLGGTLDCQNNKLSNLLGLLFKAATELTMDTNGAITVTQMVHTVDTFGDAASDDLVTINGGTTVGLIIIRPAHNDRTVVVKDGGGNIELLGGSDITLDDITDHVMLFWDTTNSKWVDFGGGGAGGGLNNVVEDATPQLGGALDVNEKFIGDGDADTGFDFEQSTDEDIIRGKVASVEAFHLSAVGILTLAKQSSCRAYLANDQTIPHDVLVTVMLDTEGYDVQNEFDSTVLAVTADGNTLNHLIDSSEDFPTLGVQVGWAVWNTDADLYALVTAVADGDLTLDSDAFPNGNEAGKVYAARFTATVGGTYLIIGQIAWKDLPADDMARSYLYKNGAITAGVIYHTSAVNWCYVQNVLIERLNALDYIELRAYHFAGANEDIRGGVQRTWMSIHKLA